jgi:hypothetical protein
MSEARASQPRAPLSVRIAAGLAAIASMIRCTYGHNTLFLAVSIAALFCFILGSTKRVAEK